MARAGIERLEGRITPNVCAFLQRQLAFGAMATGEPPLPGDRALEHPRVAAYLDIFDPAATLWEAGGPPRSDHRVIGAAIAGSLNMVPDLRYTGTDVVADGGVVMFGQWNTATVKGHKVAYPQIARNVLGDDGKTIQARRYYDRHVLVRDTLPDAPRALFDGIADSGRPPAPGRGRASMTAAELPDRLAAWNTGDTDALLRRMSGARLAGPGLPASLKTQAGKRDYLQRLFDRADLELKAGQVAFGRTTTYVEWHGTVTRKQNASTGETSVAVPFGIVERFGPDGEWELYFDTLPVLADQQTISALFARLAAPSRGDAAAV
ncbi:hypothetical protein [Streptomyces sp. NRRL F-2664]|uniref:hypothetical protein n=1 Tax=Streptomyces sp. NRRL F-2664 TaxID=1463842 RepID=UPI000B26671E|nr:hypothetical protein [Streptomyces sp. NRRL F-2664]